jgi:hypothetical protein
VELVTKEMVPLQVVPETIPTWLTDTMILTLVVRLPDGEILNQFKAVQLCSEALTIKLVAIVAVTAKVWIGGSPPLAVALNVIAVVLSVRLLLDPPPPLTVRVTPTVCVV